MNRKGNTTSISILQLRLLLLQSQLSHRHGQQLVILVYRCLVLRLPTLCLIIPPLRARHSIRRLLPLRLLPASVFHHLQLPRPPILFHPLSIRVWLVKRLLLIHCQLHQLHQHRPILFHPRSIRVWSAKRWLILLLLLLSRLQHPSPQPPQPILWPKRAPTTLMLHSKNLL